MLVRIVPDMFIWMKLADFMPMLSKNTMRERKNSGEVWGFYTSFNANKTRGKIISSADSTLTYIAPILGRNAVVIQIQ